ncbi:M28 family peptidase [Fodinibius salsisoli]|uniref:M28 family peptidase n=1 Tax=Fodinibius salsisoli TaxID=2820877 RepID=A0ABT3PLX1_9BACT|nr:M28 family peptidase [Fodinibius salsisoli]MCW9706953.1 M28 family peptidase [Fodinibius salsisoli]
MMKRFLLFLLGATLAGCMQSPIEEVSEGITEEQLLEPIEKLSSDEFQGRSTGTVGEEKTVTYLVNQLKEYGIKGGMPDGSYIQDVPLIGQTTLEEATITIQKDGEEIHAFDYYTDFMAWPSNLEEEVSIDEAELVYVGYGIQAPEENWDDFKDTDVEGKILVVKNNDPSSDPDLFKGDTRLYYGRYGYKFEKAREMGAAGVLIIHTSPSAGYGWNVVANGWNREQFYLRDSEAVESSPTKFNGWLTKEVSTALFESAGLDLEEQLTAAESRSFEPVLLDGLSLSLDLRATYRQKDAQNVLGVIEGSDSKLKDEYAVFTAHHDHLGITKPIQQDSINNGALDNAAGVSAVLNLARGYEKLQPQLKRSVLFLFVGAEEVGLLGSTYWATHPTVHPGKVSGNINLDGMNVYGETKDIVLVGYGRNSVSDVIEEVAAEQGVEVKPDPHPDRGYFYRSDHFALAKQGIPAVFPNSGTEFINRSEEYSATVDSLQNANYHTVNDEINDYWDLRGMVQDVRLFFEAGYRILNAESMQTWRQGDEFKQKRLEMLEEVGGQ